MSYLQIQRNLTKQGHKLPYVHVARSVWDPRRKRSVQKRVYVGRSDESGEQVIVSKGYPAHGGKALAMAELRRRLAAGDDLEAWLRTPVAGATAVSADLPAGVSIVGDAHCLLRLAEQTRLVPLLEEAFGLEVGRVLLGLALHQAAEGRAIYLAEDWLADREVPAEMHGEGLQSDRIYALVAKVGTDQAAQERFFHQWLESRGRPKGLICDITSISTCAADWAWRRSVSRWTGGSTARPTSGT